MRGARGMAIVLLAFGALGAAWACSSFDDSQTPAPDGGPDGSAADAPSPPDAADAATIDAADAAADAFSCDSGGLCDDFENTTLGARWAGQQLAAPGALSISTEQKKSPSHSLKVSIESDAGVGTANLFHDFTIKNVGGVVCDFDVYLERLDTSTGAEAEIFSFNILPNVDSEASLFIGYFAMGASGTQLSTQATVDGGFVPGNGQLSLALPTAQWDHFRFDLDIGANSFSVERNGSPFLVTKPLAARVTKNSGIRFYVGVGSYDRPITYFVDDVKCFPR